MQKEKLHFALLLFMSLLFVPTLSYSQVSNPNLRAVQADALDVPFTETFDTQEDFDKWTVINVDENSNKKWAYYFASENGSARYSYSSTYAANSWLFSPGLNLKPGYVYKLTYRARNSGSSTYKEDFKVTLGTSVDPDQPQTLISKHENFYSSGTTFTKEFEVETEVVHYLGFHVYSPKGRNYLDIDNVKIEVLKIKGTPAKVSGIDIVAAALGALSADISFRVPSYDTEDQPLTDITGVKIYKNYSTEVTATLPATTPGQTLYWTDDSPKNGFNAYRIVPYNTKGDGTSSIDSAYVGVDIPLAVTNFTHIKQSLTEAVLSWEAPSNVGKNGGYVDVANLKYRILRSDYNFAIDEVTGTTYTNQVNLPADLQAFIYYWIEPYSAIGVGELVSSNTYSYGTPYSAPFNESFANAKMDNKPWIMDHTGTVDRDKVKWAIVSEMRNPVVQPQDEDKGLAYFNCYDVKAGASMRLISPMIDISTLDNPKLSFWFYHYKAGGSNDLDRLQIEISADDAPYEDLVPALIKLNANNDGWTYYEYLLTDYIGKDRINVSFKGISGYGWNMAIDNISVENQYANDLQLVSVDGPKVVNVGDASAYTAVVKNNGASALTGTEYTVKLYRNDVEFLSKEGVALERNASSTFVFDVDAPSLDNVNDEYTYKVVVSFDVDNDLTNNQSDVINVKVPMPVFPVVSDLDGSVNVNSVTLTWTEPNYPKDETRAATIVTEGFESYTPFIIDNIGDWTVVDVDGGATYAPMGTAEDAYANVYKPMAFQIYNPSLADEDIANSANYAPRTGSQYIIAWGTPDVQYDPEGAAPNDDWLISPELSGLGEKLSFYAKAATPQYVPEIFQILYSTTDKELSSFTLLSGEKEEVSGVWTEFTYSVPFGAKYFAIRYISDDVYGLMIDDLTYQTQYLALSGYNVYRGSTKLTETPITETTYTDEQLANGEYVYKVSAVYDKGESYYSNSVTKTISTVGLEDVYSVANVYGVIGGITLKGAEGKQVSVITIDGKVILNTTIAETSEVITVESGVYFVKIDNRTVRVVVK